MNFMVGKKRRWYRIVNKSTNRTIIVALDHGMYAGPMRGIEKPHKVLEEIIHSEANAIIVTPGIYEKYIDIIAPSTLGIVLRIDESGTVYNPNQGRGQHLVCSISQAAKIGVDGIITMGYIGSELEPKNLALTAYVSEKAREYGLIYVLEMFPTGPKISNPGDPEVLKVATRFAAEIGADLIKTFYTGNPENFREVVEGSFIPIVILGGPKRESIRELLIDVKNAVNAGAIGVAFGRNIWQYRDPAKMIKALAKIIHEEKSVEEALQVL